MTVNSGPLLKMFDYSLSELSTAQRLAIPSPDPPLAEAHLPEADRSSTREYIPVCEPDLDPSVTYNLQKCVDENWVSSGGRFVTEFETRFAQIIGTKHCIATSSGTTALQLLLAACGVSGGDEVIIPAFTMVAVAGAVVHLGARPVFVDCAPGSENIDLDGILKKITDRTKAIVVVHTYGRPFDVETLQSHVDRNRIAVIEDAAESHGATLKGRTTGSLGYGGAFSFYANKIITTGEGGAVTTDNDSLASVCRTLRDHAFSLERHFWHRYRGYNFRMTNLQASVGVSQLLQFDKLCEGRKRIAARYSEALKGLDGVILPVEDEETEHAFWVYFIRIDSDSLTRDDVRRELANNGIETRTAFIPLHLQPAYREYCDKNENFKHAEHLSATGLYLPSSSKLTSAELEYIYQSLQETIRSSLKSPSK